MLLTKNEVDGLLGVALSGRSPQAYAAKAAEVLLNWMDSPGGGSSWMALGPWWPVVQRLILAHHPEALSVRQWNGGSEPPDYLAHYDFGNEARNAVAALAYLNRNGDYLEHPQTPHSIEMMDGERRLYLPGVGLVDERESG